MSIYMQRLFPKHNSSFPLSKGNALKAEVVRLTEEKFLVDAGIGTPKICKKDELTGVPHAPPKGSPAKPKIHFENKVGFMDIVAREALIKEQTLERFFIDLVAGDAVAQDRAAARFNDLVGTADGVPGEPHVLLPRRFRQDRAWAELNKICQKKTKVNGFIIERIRGGYAVAIAGYIAFLPYRPGNKRRLSSDLFTIESIKKNNIIVF